MRIKSMTATFGRLDRERLEPGPGLTLIHAPNEGGKSTWAAFWRAMLYGIDTRDRDRKGYLADKNRYQPWSGAPMEGEVTLEYEGRDITLRRGPRGSTPFGAFSAVYAGTQEPVPGLTAANCGELLTGAGPEVFARSAFLGGGELSLTTAPELERRIAALVTSGEEDVSFSQAMGRLRDWKNRRQVNRSVGEIPKLEAELAQVEESLARLEEVSAQAARLEGEHALLTRERERLSRQAEAHRLLARRQLSDRCAQAEEEYQAARKQLDNLETELSARPIPDREELKKAQGELQYLKALEEEIRQGEPALKEAEQAAEEAKQAAQDEHFPGLSGEEAVAKAAQIAAAAQTDAEKLGRLKRMTLPLSILFLLFAALLGAAAFSLTKNIPLSAALAAMICAAAVLGAVLARHRARAIEKRTAALLEPFGAGEPAQLTALAQDYRERCRKAERAAHEEEVIRNAVAERKSRRDETKSNLLDFVHAFAPEVRDLFGCSAALSRALGMEHELALARERAAACRRRLDDLAAQGGGQPELPAAELPAAQLPVPDMDPGQTRQALARTSDELERASAQLNQARGTLQAMGDPAALAAQKEQLERTLARKRLEFDALTAAMDALTQANARLQERFSPELNALAGEYMARLTGNRYPAVSLTRELEGFVRGGADVLPRSALYLSRGTADQLYLAVRLAVCALCLPEKPPLFLDDALTAFDDRRLESALELLWELSGGQQVLLFTCQKREGEVLARTPGVTKLSL